MLWLSPVYPSPQDDNGYDISDYTDIDPVFGTLADFDELLAEVHARGMKLMIDLVVNHTSDEHPWFLRVPPRPGRPQAGLVLVARPAARHGSRRARRRADQLGLVLLRLGLGVRRGQRRVLPAPVLPQAARPELGEPGGPRRPSTTMMRWWLDRGVDGFRMDVINMISKEPPLPDGAVRSSAAVTARRTSQRPAHPRVPAGDARARSSPAGPGTLLTVGEMPGVTVEQARLFTDPARARGRHGVPVRARADWTTAIDKFDPTACRLTDLKASLGRWQAGLADVGWNSLYWNNHDQPRAVSRFGDDGALPGRSAKLLATVLHLHRGTPYIYQGEELGMTNAAFDSISDFRDIESLNYYAEAMAGEGPGRPVVGDPLEDRTAAGSAGGASGSADGASGSAGGGHRPDEGEVLAALRRMSRDNARTPMQWTAGPQAGFSSAEPWIAVNPNHRQINAEAQLTDPDSVFSHYRKLIALRHAHPIVARGDFTMLLPEDEHVYAFRRQLDSEQWLVLGNFSGAEVAVPLADAPDWATAELLLGNYPEPVPPDSAALSLRPWECRVYRRIAG